MTRRNLLDDVCDCFFSAAVLSISSAVVPRGVRDFRGLHAKGWMEWVDNGGQMIRVVPGGAGVGTIPLQTAPQLPGPLVEAGSEDRHAACCEVADFSFGRAAGEGQQVHGNPAEGAAAFMIQRVQQGAGFRTLVDTGILLESIVDDKLQHDLEELSARVQSGSAFLWARTGAVVDAAAVSGEGRKAVRHALNDWLRLEVIQEIRRRRSSFLIMSLRRL